MIAWLTTIFTWIHETTLAENIRDSVWLFPLIESTHVVAIVFVIGSISRVDLRLMGLINRDQPMTDVHEEMLPYTWTGFAIATIFGLLMWVSKPLVYLGMPFFDVKLGLMLLAFLNMLYFEYLPLKTVSECNRNPFPPIAARLSGAMSLALWVSVVICGRFMGFV
jgi:hypothetical protein